MKEIVCRFMALVMTFIVSCTAYADWEPPTVVIVSQEGGQISKVGKYGSNVYVLNTAGPGQTLKFYKSTDGGATFDSGRILGYNVFNGVELEMKVGTNGHIHVFWTSLDDDILYYRRSIDNGNTFSNRVALTMGMDWAMEPHCFVENSNNIYLVFSAYGSPRSEVYFVKSTNGGSSFGSPIRVTNNSIQEDNPKINVFDGTIFIVYNDIYESQNLYLIRSTDGGSSFNSPVRVNKTDRKSDSGSDISINSMGTIFVPYKDIENDYEGDLYVARSIDGGNSFDYVMAADSTYRYQEHPKIVIFNDIIYLSWHDFRHNNGEVYLTRSVDGGETYEPNFNVSNEPDMQFIRSLLADNDGVYMLATDYGYSPYATKLYITREVSTDPIPDIKANGSDGPLTIPQGDLLVVTAALDPGGHGGKESDWWVAATSPFGLYWYTLGSGWVRSDAPIRVYGGPLFSLPPYTVLEMSTLPAGSYTFYFGCDMDMNGLLDRDRLYYDSVEVNITSP